MSWSLLANLKSSEAVDGQGPGPHWCLWTRVWATQTWRWGPTGQSGHLAWAKVQGPEIRAARLRGVGALSRPFSGTRLGWAGILSDT